MQLPLNSPKRNEMKILPKGEKRNTIKIKIFPENTIEIQSKLNLKKRNPNSNIRSKIDLIK